MSTLAVLDQPRIFPPKRIYIAIWGVTLVVALFGLIVTPYDGRIVVYLWLVVAGAAFWQLWTLYWIQVDGEGIRIRNLAQRGRALRWEEITRFHEEEVRLHKGEYVLLVLSNEPTEAGHRPTKITITSDQIGFDTLRDIVRAAVPIRSS